MAKKALTQPPKGTRDFLPADIHKREYVTRIIREVYESHGFLPLETPTFERLDTLLGKYGDEGDQLVFKILHRGQPLVDGIREASTFLAQPGAIVTGRSGETAPGAERLLSDMGLRYDLTVPLARVVAEYQGKLPPVFKRYQIQPVWRADTPGKGRFREFYQCDVDVVGAPSLLVEAEVTGAVAECLLRLGFQDFEIRLNHRGLLRAFIEHAGIDPAREGDAITALDKLDKVGAEGVRAELGAKSISPEAQDKLLSLVLGEQSPAALRRALEGNARAEQALKEVEELLALARHTPASSHLVFNATLARGLGYYTGCIFEIAVKDLAGSIGGGGRYDNLVGMFLGKDIPACGFSLGLERILVVMEQRGMFPETAGAIDVVVGALGGVEPSAALALAYELRGAGFKVELSSKFEGPGKLRKAAEERGVRHVALLREDGAINLWSRAAPTVVDRQVPRAGLARALRE